MATQATTAMAAMALDPNPPGAGGGDTPFFSSYREHRSVGVCTYKNNNNNNKNNNNSTMEWNT
jgi:hypothetical protein